MPGLGIVFNGEGEERRPRWGAQLPDWLIASAKSSSLSMSLVFDPDSESAVHTCGGQEIGVDGWGEPVDLFLLAMYPKAGDWRFIPR